MRVAIKMSNMINATILAIEQEKLFNRPGIE